MKKIAKKNIISIFLVLTVFFTAFAFRGSAEGGCPNRISSSYAYVMEKSNYEKFENQIINDKFLLQNGMLKKNGNNMEIAKNATTNLALENNIVSDVEDKEYQLVDIFYLDTKEYLGKTYNGNLKIQPIIYEAQQILKNSCGENYYTWGIQSDSEAIEKLPEFNVNVNGDATFIITISDINLIKNLKSGSYVIDYKITTISEGEERSFYHLDDKVSETSIFNQIFFVDRDNNLVLGKMSTTVSYENEISSGTSCIKINQDASDKGYIRDTITVPNELLIYEGSILLETEIYRIYNGDLEKINTVSHSFNKTYKNKKLKDESEDVPEELESNWDLKDSKDSKDSKYISVLKDEKNTSFKVDIDVSNFKNRGRYVFYETLYRKNGPNKIAIIGAHRSMSSLNQSFEVFNPEIYDFLIKKIDSDTKRPLKEAGFNLKSGNSNENYISNKRGMFTVALNKGEKYTLEETKAPDGYSNNNKKIELSYDGQKLLINNEEFKSDIYEIENTKIKEENSASSDKETGKEEDKEQDKEDKKLEKENTSQNNSKNKASSSNNKKTYRAISKINRISGKDRIETACKVSRKMYPSGSKNVIITNKDSFSDILTAIPLSVQLKAPILLTNSDSMSKNVEDEIKRLNADTIYINGGNKSISENIKMKLEDNDKKLYRFNGVDRYETAKLIAEKVREKGNKSAIELASGETFPDALSISSLSVKENTPILLSKKNDLTDFTKSAIREWNLEKVVIAGQTNTLSSKIEDMIKYGFSDYNDNKVFKGVKNTIRLGGSDRYDTSAIIAEYVFPKAEKGVYASGEKFSDSLVAGQYAEINNSPILLVKKNRVPKVIENYTKESGIRKITIIGGEESVSDSVYEELLNLIRKR